MSFRHGVVAGGQAYGRDTVPAGQAGTRPARVLLHVYNFGHARQKILIWPSANLVPGRSFPVSRTLATTSLSVARRMSSGHASHAARSASNVVGNDASSVAVVSAVASSCASSSAVLAAIRRFA